MSVGMSVSALSCGGASSRLPSQEPELPGRWESEPLEGEAARAVRRGRSCASDLGAEAERVRTEGPRPIDRTGELRAGSARETTHRVEGGVGDSAPTSLSVHFSSSPSSFASSTTGCSIELSSSAGSILASTSALYDAPQMPYACDGDDEERGVEGGATGRLDDDTEDGQSAASLAEDADDEGADASGKETEVGFPVSASLVRERRLFASASPVPSSPAPLSLPPSPRAAPARRSSHRPRPESAAPGAGPSGRDARAIDGSSDGGASAYAGPCSAVALPPTPFASPLVHASTAPPSLLLRRPSPLSSPTASSVSSITDERGSPAPCEFEGSKNADDRYGAHVCVGPAGDVLGAAVWADGPLPLPEPCRDEGSELDGYATSDASTGPTSTLLRYLCLGSDDPYADPCAFEERILGFFFAR